MGMERIVIGISGASGMILAIKTVEAVIKAGYAVDLIVSKAALLTIYHEFSMKFSLENFAPEIREYITLHPINDFSASIASGSFKTLGMIIVPCSMATLAGVALGISDNLLKRAADVTLKERRKLLLVPRETPLSAIHLQHMLRLTEMGAIMLPPMPAWYTKPQTVEEIEDFIVGRILDLFLIPHTLYRAWEGNDI
jgi:4-hydroxy-3-polyprenylbenzoate decarboxylase